jgi:hypothetical protein
VRAQVVWHAICTVEQASWHEVLTLALLVVVAAPVGAVPGTRQLLWHAAACELQTIMHVVTAEVCASRIFAAADAAPANPSLAAPSDKTANTIAKCRMSASPGADAKAPS